MGEVCLFVFMCLCVCACVQFASAQVCVRVCVCMRVFVVLRCSTMSLSSKMHGVSLLLFFPLDSECVRAAAAFSF